MDAKQWRRQQVAASQEAEAAARAALQRKLEDFGIDLAAGPRTAVEGLREYASICGEIPVTATFQDGSRTDVGVLVFDLPDRLHPYFMVSHVGGEVATIAPSPLALPTWVVAAARHTAEYRMSSFEPLQVALGGQMRFLLPAFSLFLKHEEYRGSDLTYASGNSPSVVAYRKGELEWVSNCEEEMVRIYCGKLD
jgi:hypothetical protein